MSTAKENRETAKAVGGVLYGRFRRNFRRYSEDWDKDCDACGEPLSVSKGANLKSGKIVGFEGATEKGVPIDICRTCHQSLRPRPTSYADGGIGDNAVTHRRQNTFAPLTA